MIKKYKLIIQDTSNKLELNKIYKIKNNRYIVSDVDDTIILYGVSSWQLKNMFEEVQDDEVLPIK